MNVEQIFGIAAEENLNVMEALGDSCIEFITVRPEQAAALWQIYMVVCTGRKA